MKTLGIDLASAADKTAWCLLEWRGGEAAAVALGLGADDEQLVEAAQRADHVGVDAPCGWPRAFVQMLREPPWPMAWPADRDALRFRETDHLVQQVTGLWPLSVSSDLIGVVAMRCRGLLARLGAEGVGCLEVYPAASLHLWGIAARGYKGAKRREVLQERVDALLQVAQWLRLPAELEERVRRSDDAFDALVASMAVRAHHAGHVREEHACPDEAARAEGWIVLPAPGSLSLLADEPR